MSIKISHTKTFTTRFKPLVQEDYPLYILEDLGTIKKVRRVLAECPECKKPFNVKLPDIKRGASTKCRSCANTISSTTHGKSHTKLHNVWTSMKQRCYNPKSTHYSYYGGNGVTICKTWKESFEPFCDWALANGYKEGLTIDKDFLSNPENKIYSPETCMWVTRQEQATYRNSKNSNNTSGFANIKKDTTRNKWEVYFMYKRKRYFVGRFNNINKAIEARDKKKKEIMI